MNRFEAPPKEEYNTDMRVAARVRAQVGHLNYAILAARSRGYSVAVSRRSSYDGDLVKIELSDSVAERVRNDNPAEDLAEPERRS